MLYLCEDNKNIFKIIKTNYKYTINCQLLYTSELSMFCKSMRMTMKRIFTVLHQLLHFRERSQTAFEDSRYLRDQDTVIGDRDALVLTAGDAVFHFTFIQHTATAVHHHLIGRNIIWKFCSGGKFKYRFPAGIIADPLRHLAGSDISTLTVMCTTFGNEDTVTVLDRRKRCNTFELCFELTLVSCKKNGKRSQSDVFRNILGNACKGLTVCDNKLWTDTLRQKMIQCAF